MEDPAKKLGALADVANLLYASYFARDFFAKIVPGAILTIAILFFLGVFPKIGDLEKIPFVLWLLFLGFFYAVGFGVQAFGQMFPSKNNPIVQIYTNTSRIDYNETVRKFMGSAPSMYIRAQRERYVVIKEFYGNLCVAILFVVILFCLNKAYLFFIKKCTNECIERLPQEGIIAILALSMAWYFFKGNKRACKEEWNWVNYPIIRQNTEYGRQSGAPDVSE